MPLSLTTPHFFELSPLSVPADVGVLVFVVVQARFLKSLDRGLNVSTIIDTISRDAVIFFVLISTSHVLNVILTSTARVRFFSPMFMFSAC